MHPERRLVLLVGALVLGGLAASLLPAIGRGWTSAALLLLLVASFDLLAALRQPRVTFARTLPDAFAVGTWNRINVSLALPPGARTQRIAFFDHAPAESEVRAQPQSAVLPPGSQLRASYDVRMLARGEHTFAPASLQVRSPLGLWVRGYRAGAAEATKTYPDFAAISQSTLLALDHRVAALGVHKQRRRGLGLDFHQLREYRDGDLLRQIDWKATSRRRELISREYQDERDQQVVFLLDCGQRMRAMDGALSQFDHALGALMLVAYVALREGDAVGLCTFGGHDRWLPPKKGAGTTAALLQQVFDLQPTLQPSDYTEAVARLLARQRRRALVVLLTNLREEDSDELPALVRTVGRRHLVVVASLREQSIEARLDRPIEELDDALTYAATRRYLGERSRAIAELDRGGALAVDVRARDLPAALASKYLEIKRSGRL